ncbi:hypothetical protein MHU86_1120 [Fragilaria crotonensis]|nr:hypothetical protein MHU86_1120 [Fragilaria crotonensis]
MILNPSTTRERDDRHRRQGAAMCTFANTEHVALLSICLSNAGVKAFERGDLDKAIRYMTWALHPDLAMSSSETKDRRMSKKTLMKVIKSQAHTFLPDQSFELRRSTTFGRRRSSREHSPSKQVTDATEQSSFYSYRRLFCVKASSSEPILCQTSQDQLRAIFLANLAICYHFYAGDICKAKRSYELAVAAASESGDLLVELVVWNNLLQLHSDDLLEEEAARACMVQLERILSDPRASDLLSMLGRNDRRGFLLNVIFFSFPGTIAPAA